MIHMRKKNSSFLKNNIAATSIEYGLIAALVATVIITTIIVLGNGLRSTYCTVSIGVGGGGGPSCS
jgi:pilus assembly protein Flp/PilA